MAKKRKEYKAIFVDEDTHKRAKVIASQEGLTIGALVKFLVDKVVTLKK